MQCAAVVATSPSGTPQNDVEVIECPEEAVARVRLVFTGPSRVSRGPLTPRCVTHLQAIVALSTPALTVEEWPV